MLRATFKRKNGRDCLIIGLSRENVRRLQAGIGDNFIKVNGTDVGLPVDVIVFAGDTEQSMARELADMIGPSTRVNIDPKVSDA